MGVPVQTEYKFITTRLRGFGPVPGDAKYFNWADVAEMLSRYGAEGWKVNQMTATEVGDDDIVYAFVLERPGVGPVRRRTR